MKWKTKKVEKPNKGDVRQVVKFAFLPTEVEGNYIWFEKYISVQEYQDYVYQYDNVVSQGVFTEKYSVEYGVAQGWVEQERKII